MNIHERINVWQTDEGVSLFTQMHFPERCICLDFGCGFGEYSIAFALAYPNSTVYAIDKNAKALKAVADKMAKKLNGDMPFEYLEKGMVLNFGNIK